MSAQDDRDQNGFLGRWIKRKAQARAQDPVEEKQGDEPSEKQETRAAPVESGAEKAREPGAGRPGEPEEPAFDLSQLPKLEDISAETSLADFMRKEVPAALRNAALKRAWALDPAIRDYVNPAREYAYDWNTPGGVPGNGPIEAASDAIRKVAEAMQSKVSDHTFGLGETTEEVAPAGDDSPMEISQPPSPVRVSDATKTKPPTELSERNGEKSTDASAAAQPDSQEKTELRPRRRHGGAAPA